MSRTEPSLGGRSDVREGSALSMRRSRGAMSGFLLVLLCIWRAIIPFVRPYFGYTFSLTVLWFFTHDLSCLGTLLVTSRLLGGL